jgi:exoribonuclease R
MRELEEEAWFSFLRPEEIEAIFAIYLNESSLKFRGNQAKDLFRKLKQVQHEAKDVEANLLSTFEREAS